MPPQAARVRASKERPHTGPHPGALRAPVPLPQAV